MPNWKWQKKQKTTPFLFFFLSFSFNGLLSNERQQQRPAIVVNQADKKELKTHTVSFSFLVRQDTYFQIIRQRARKEEKQPPKQQLVRNRSGGSSISSSPRNSRAVNKEKSKTNVIFYFIFFFVFFIFFPPLFLLEKINHKSRRQDEITRDYRKMNYLPNRWRQRVALHWLQAVSRLRCSARSTVVYHPAVFGTL